MRAIRHNVGVVRSRVGSRQILAVVKANAYGHGTVPVARTLAAAGADVLGVSHIEEALELREAGLSLPLVLLFGFAPPDAVRVIEHEVVPVIWRIDQAQALSDAAGRLNRPASYHVKIDTGMGRVGVRPDQAMTVIREMVRLPAIRLDGLSSHCSGADSQDASVTEEQIRIFRGVLSSLAAEGIVPGTRHMANSAAVLRFPEAWFDMVRTGLMLYGYNPLGRPSEAGLEPAMTFRTRVVAVKKVPRGTPVSYGGTFRTARESVLATVSAGYADGVHRCLSNRGRVLIGGLPVPVVGRVCMDLMMVDVTEVEGVSVGDEVVLFGRQCGSELWADEVAAWAGTIPYEILTSVGHRVTRVYHEG